MAGLPVTQKSNKSINTQVAEKTRLESRLEELLSNVEGVGKVEVIIMTGDEGNTDSFSISSKNEVTGVLVAAQGAGSAVTVQNIQQAIMALFQIDANKIIIENVFAESLVKCGKASKIKALQTFVRVIKTV